jgi:histidyl-tRNA synthetase
MNSLPGFRDFYPESLAIRRYVFGKWREAARRYGFREYDGPPLEPLELYTQKSGEEIVGQLYNFVDKGERPVALRPEMTPTLARMVGAHHRDYKKPIKWFAIPQLFRYERQQRGRLREHFQFNADIIGESDVSADAELIALAIDTLRGFGLTEQDFVVRVSSRASWEQKFLRLGLVSAEKQGAAFQAIDKLEREPIERTTEKLIALGLTQVQIDEVLAFAGKRSMNKPDEELAELQPVFNLLGNTLGKFCEPDFKIVRGLAYYTSIVWEIHDRKGELRALAGGGRYDTLLKRVSGVDLPALGFGMGDVVLTELLKERGLLPGPGSDLDCYVVITSENLRNLALLQIHDWRDQGLAIDYGLTTAKVGKQFQAASASGARFAVIFGTEEWQQQEVKLKNLASGVEEQVKILELAEKVRKGK